MSSTKHAILGAIALSFAAGASFADVKIVDAIAGKHGQISSAKMDGDAFPQEFNFAVGSLGRVDKSLGRYDADYEVVLTERGQPVGVAVFGHHDADYDAYLTPETFFVTAALGSHDADYEVVLTERGQPVGVAVFGHHDADYDAYLTPETFFATAALGSYDADYEAVLEAREPLGARFFWKGFDYASLD